PCSPSRRSWPSSSCARSRATRTRASPNANGVSPIYARWRCPDDRFDRYRGVDLEDLVGTVPFEQVWGLLVDGALLPGLPPAEPHPLAVRSGDPRVDVQAALAMLAPEWGFRPLI